ncbi:putative ankyrin repeat protein (Yar1), partial [Aspergillus nomiae NRRL 13137]
LNFLLGVLTQAEAQLDQAQVAAVINHRNHSGNTALHWAALNTHLECVKALVGAGADISITNDAGLDPVFLAERADWSTEEQGEEQDEAEAEVEAEAQEGEGDAGKMSKGRQVVEWLLSSEKGSELESGAGENAPAAAEGSMQ